MIVPDNGDWAGVVRPVAAAPQAVVVARVRVEAFALVVGIAVVGGDLVGRGNLGRWFRNRRGFGG